MIIVDTGFWVALSNDRDEYHQRAIFTFSEIHEPLITTWPVMTETCHLLLKRRGIQAQLSFIKSYQQGAFLVFDLERKHRNQITELMQRYADLPMDLADASLVILAESLEDGRIFSTDKRDFHAYRWKNTHPFTNLFLLAGQNL